MGKDVTAFRERFNAYKNGKSVSEIYDAGLPKYASGTASIIDQLDQDQLDTLHYIHNYFSDRGMGLADISGIMANIFKESSFRDSAKDSAGYHGYVQMSPDMQTAVMNAYGNLDRDTQLQFIIDQITGNSRVKGYTNGFGYKYGQYKTGGDAAEAFRATFERNKAGRQQSRIDYGDQFYNYLSNLTAQTALQKQVGEQPMPIVEKPDAVIVRKTIPKSKTRARWTGAENVSPYLTGKPILKLKKEIKPPNVVELHKESQWKAPMQFKDGKLPEYGGGKVPYVASNGTQYNIDPNVVGSDQVNITTPEVVVTGTDRRPMYQRYDAENSTYDPNAVRMFTDWAPVVGDVGQSLDAYNAFKNKDYTTAAILGGLTILPNVAENFGKYTYKGLRQLGISQDFAKDILLNGEAAWKRFKNLDIFDKLRGIKYTDDVYHGSKNAFDINHARAYAPAGMDTGFHMGSSPTPAYSRANGLQGGALYSGKLKLKEAPFELDDLNRWGWREIIAEADNNPKFKKYLEDKGIDLDRLLNTAQDLEKEYDNLDSFGQQAYLKEHGGFESDKYMAKLFKDKNVSFKYKNKFETFDGVPEYSYAIYNPDNVVWNRPFLFSERKQDLEKLYDIGMAGKYYWNDPDKITIQLDDLYRVLKDFPQYRLPGFKNGKLPGYADGKIHIKPANRGKFTALKKRTGHSASWFKENGTPAQKKMAVFALNAKKWKH